MTDNEIIKALDCCMSGRCSWCPAEEKSDCQGTVMKDALALINRQKAEIEKMKESERLLICQLAEEREKTIKEFVARCKEKADYYYAFVLVENIEKIAEDMKNDR